MRPILLFLILMIAPVFICFANADEPRKPAVENVLISEGVDSRQAKSILQDPRLRVDTDIIIKNLFYSSPRGTAKRPDIMDISPRQIEQARAFMAEHADCLASVEARYGASPRIVTAILLIESRLGTYPMPYNVASAYVNLAWMLDSEYFKEIQKLYADKYPQLIHDDATIARAKRKAAWAARELAYLIHIANHLHVDPLTITGSFSGAMGPAQFIPSSFWIFGLDADGDGLASPFDLADAGMSMGNYLKKYGWREKATDEEKRKAIWHYNRSSVYVNTVMMVYEKLR